MSHNLAIQTLPLQDDRLVEVSFFTSSHQDLLATLGRTLPFVPVEHENAVWRCTECGRTRHFPVSVLTYSRTEFWFRPNANDKDLACNNVVFLRTWEHDGQARWDRWGWTTPRVRSAEHGPRWTPPAHATLLREVPGCCPGTTWDWPEADRAAEQVAFLALLPFWVEAHRALQQGIQQESNGWTQGRLPFPSEWMGDSLASVVLYHRLQRLERAMAEVIGKMNQAGHSLSFGTQG